MRNNALHPLATTAMAILVAVLTAGAAAAMPLAPLPANGSDPTILKIQSICGTLGNCGVGLGGINTLPRHTITPDIGRFDLGHDKRFGRYRYEPPDPQLNIDVPTVQGNRRLPAAPRYTGTKTIYKVGKLSAEHVDWCYAKYKSYRARDNTYQPTQGGRKVCVSPFS